MKKEFAQYVISQFTDFAGKIHHFTLCALSQSPEKEVSVAVLDDCDEIDYDYEISPVIRAVSLGIAVCNPEDEYNEEKGKLEAYKRAKFAVNPCIYSTEKGAITADLVNTFLKTKCEYIINNPEVIIKGYNDAKKRFFDREELKEFEDHMSDEDKTLVNAIKKNKDLSLHNRLAKKQLNDEA
jgi:hypothetical protein